MAENREKQVVTSSEPLVPYSIFTSRQKALVVTIVSVASTFSGFASNIYFPAIPTIAVDLSVTPELGKSRLIGSHFGSIHKSDSQKPLHSFNEIVALPVWKAIVLTSATSSQPHSDLISHSARAFAEYLGFRGGCSWPQSYLHLHLSRFPGRMCRFGRNKTLLPAGDLEMPSKCRKCEYNRHRGRSHRRYYPTRREGRLHGDLSSWTTCTSCI